MGVCVKTAWLSVIPCHAPTSISLVSSSCLSFLLCLWGAGAGSWETDMEESPSIGVFPLLLLCPQMFFPVFPPVLYSCPVPFFQPESPLAIFPILPLQVMIMGWPQ